MPVKLYAFDGIDESLELVPLAARRALDTSGRKLSLKGFLSLPLASRQRLADSGSEEVVDVREANQALQAVVSEVRPIAPIADPPIDHTPLELIRLLGSEYPLPDKSWQNLSAIDRYALAKVATTHRRERLLSAYEEIVGQSAFSTHLRPQGGVHMVGISRKQVTVRRATAECWVTMTDQAFTRLREHRAPKGDVLGTARLAGIVATKRTPDLIPLCHPLALTHVEIDFEEDAQRHRIRILCDVEVEAKTGVEMEAMMGANIAALTIYDMLKSIDRGMSLGPCRLLRKTGGRSGAFVATPTPKSENE